MKSRDIRCSGLAAFDLSIKYMDLNIDNPKDYPSSHVHAECEIYMNLSGDVSFMVENCIYPVFPGNIIITRPYEYHHCIYHSNAQHRHFWILFSGEQNIPLLDLFFDRPLGHNNLLTLTPNETEAFITLCHKIIDIPMTEFDKTLSFVKLIELLSNAVVAVPELDFYPNDVSIALKYIEEHFTEVITVGSLAQAANVSVNTLERHFKKYLTMPPYVYLKKKRLTNAVKLLSQGSTVTDACTESGFTDYCGFIALFRKTYGMTPLAYKKSLMSHTISIKQY